jgi:hypothetical protein
LQYISELIDRKLSGPERSILEDADMDFHQKEYKRLYNELEEAARVSTLPETPTGRSPRPKSFILVGDECRSWLYNRNPA